VYTPGDTPVPELAQAWLARVNEASGGVDLSQRLDDFPEPRDALVPVGFELIFDSDFGASYLVAEEGQLRGELTARLLAPGMDAETEPPEAGAVGLMLSATDRTAFVETLDVPRPAQRQGLGRLMMAAIADLADHLGLTAIEIQAGRTGRYA